MRSIITITLLLLTTTIGFAQEDSSAQYSQTRFGIKGGLTLNTFSTTTDFNNTDVYFGLFSETRLSTKWYLQNELLLALNEDVAFIEVPVLLKSQLFNNFSIYAGPQLDIATENTTLAKDGLSQFSAVKASATAGIEYHFAKNLFIEARYSQGLTKNIDLNNASNGVRRNSFKLGLGYKF